MKSSVIKKVKKIYVRIVMILALVTVMSFSFSSNVKATPATNNTNNELTYPNQNANGNADALNDDADGISIIYNNNSGKLSSNLKILLVLTVIALAPSILIMLTSFTRIIVVLHFVRQALGTQTSPPNQVLVGLALFLTIFIMQPVFTNINDTALKPFDAGEITQEQAIEIGQKPLREFMYSQTQTKDLNLFMEIEEVEDYDDIPITVLIPSFVISELRTAFIIGFLIYIPFIIIDMVVASTLMSMGMMMLPPTTISMPFKILLFILADGWDLVIGNLVKTFY